MALPEADAWILGYDNLLYRPGTVTSFGSGTTTPTADAAVPVGYKHTNLIDGDKVTPLKVLATSGVSEVRIEWRFDSTWISSGDWLGRRPTGDVVDLDIGPRAIGFANANFWEAGVQEIQLESSSNGSTWTVEGSFINVGNRQRVPDLLLAWDGELPAVEYWRVRLWFDNGAHTATISEDLIIGELMMLRTLFFERNPSSGLTIGTRPRSTREETSAGGYNGVSRSGVTQSLTASLRGISQAEAERIAFAHSASEGQVYPIMLVAKGLGHGHAVDATDGDSGANVDPASLNFAMFGYFGSPNLPRTSRGYLSTSGIATGLGTSSLWDLELPFERIMVTGEWF